MGSRNDRSYTKYRKDYCENRDGRLGIVCAWTGPFEKGQLGCDHIDGNRFNNDESNIQTLCSMCHARKTHMNKDYLNNYHNKPQPKVKKPERNIAMSINYKQIAEETSILERHNAAMKEYQSLLKGAVYNPINPNKQNKKEVDDSENRLKPFRMQLLKAARSAVAENKHLNADDTRSICGIEPGDPLTKKEKSYQHNMNTEAREEARKIKKFLSEDERPSLMSFMS